MDTTGIQLVTEFNKILEQYAASPFGFRLRKSGRPLKLLEYNGLLYLNLNNLYNIIDELLGPNIPNSIMEYLQQIIFSEEITIETKNGYESCQVTCVQFIDERFFERCNEWVIKKSRKDQKDPNENLFKMLYGDNDLIDSFFEVRNSNLDSMFPFQDFFEQEKLSNSREMDFREYCSDPRLNNQIKGTIRPRGKNMDSLSFDPIARPYACDVPFCNRAFKRNEHLKRHQKMHSGEKPFRCTYLNCKKSFSRSDNLAQHLKTHNTRIENNECLRKISENSFGKY